MADRSKAHNVSARVAHHLRRLRLAAGLSQARLARKVDVSESYVSMLETGARGNPDLGVVGRVAKVFGVDPVELFKEYGP